MGTNTTSKTSTISEGTGVGTGGGGQGGFVPAPPPPPHTHFQTQNLGLGIEPTDICDVILAWLASRCWARQMCPPHTHTHFVTFLRRRKVNTLSPERKVKDVAVLVHDPW